MKHLVSAKKLPRFQYILDNQTDKRRFVDRILERFETAEEVYVVDPTGLNFHYFPQLPGETKEVAMNKVPLKVPKAKVDEYNKKAMEELEQGQMIDFDSTETLIAQMKFWVETTVLKTEEPLTEDDIIYIIAAYGPSTLGKFVYEFTKNGKITDATKPRQVRFSSPRADVKTLLDAIEVLEDNTLVVDSVNPKDIREKLAELLNGEASPDDGEDPYVFPEDISLEVTHFKDGLTYIGSLAPTSFDFFGNFYFRIEEKVEPLVLDDLKFSATQEWSDVSNRYHHNFNQGDSVFLLINASGITKPFQASLLELNVPASGLFSTITGPITLNPGLNVIPFTASTPITETVMSTGVAVVSKGVTSFDDPKKVVYGTSQDINFHQPAVVMTPPVLGGAPMYGQAEAIATGIPVNWTNRATDYDTKVLAWSSSVAGAEIIISEPNNHTSVLVKLPATVNIGDKVKTILTTDVGPVEFETELMG